LGSLRTLDLTRNNLTDAGLAHLAASSHLKGLTRLYLCHNPITDAGLRRLAAAPLLQQLTMLAVGLSGYSAIDAEADFSDAGVRALLESPLASRLADLEVYGCSLSPETSAMLQSRFGWHHGRPF